MLAREIQMRIEVEAFGVEKNAHGWRFRAHLLPEPQLSELKDPAGKSCQVWTVLREPDNGYLIIYDPEEMEFGLATGGVIIGTYEGFLETLNAM